MNTRFLTFDEYVAASQANSRWATERVEHAYRAARILDENGGHDLHYLISAQDLNRLASDSPPTPPDFDTLNLGSYVLLATYDDRRKPWDYRYYVVRQPAMFRYWEMVLTGIDGVSLTGFIHDQTGTGTPIEITQANVIEVLPVSWMNDPFSDNRWPAPSR